MHEQFLALKPPPIKGKIEAWVADWENIKGQIVELNVTGLFGSETIFINEFLQSGKKWAPNFCENWVMQHRAAKTTVEFYETTREYRLAVESFLNEAKSTSRKIQGLVEVLIGALFFTKFDIRDAFNSIRIRAGDEWKTAFRCRYGHYEYLVMPFGLANAPATFQAYIHEALREYLDVFVVVYLDDILVFSKKIEEHANHVRMILEKLRKYNLHAKLSKCLFDKSEIEYLGFILTPTGIRMDPSRITTITNWPEPKNHRDVQVFLGFANFYRRFIDGFSRIVTALTTLLKGGKRGKFDGQFTFTTEAKESFEKLKLVFTTAPMLLHFDPKRKIQLETDASGVAISAIISQLVEETGRWHPIAFWSRKMAPAELNYGVGETEMLAIVEACKQWRHYLEGACIPFV